MVLVDTSVWVTHLRQGHPHLQRLLEEGSVACDPFIIGELACGNFENRTEIIALLEMLPKTITATHEEALQFIEAHQLSSKGLGYIDVHLLASASLTQIPLWSLDRALAREAMKLNLGYSELPL